MIFGKARDIIIAAEKAIYGSVKKMKEYTVDRIEKGIAVCMDDAGRKRSIPVSSIPFDINEGDILVFEDTDEPSGKNAGKSDRARRDVSERLDRLFERGKKE